MESFEKFHQLHHDKSPLLIGNVWNVESAKIFEKSGFKAIATSSWAVAHSLGFEDGENIAFEWLYQMAKNIISHVNIPFSVDLEAGYSRDVNEIIQHIEMLSDLGIAGINLEDSVMGELRSPENFAETLATIKNQLREKGIDVFINARTDAYLLKIPSPFQETIKRVKTYENAGADGLFVPYLDDMDEISQVVAATKLPLNVFCTTRLPSFKVLGEIGVKRISMGASVYKFMNSTLEKTISTILQEGTFRSLYL